mgnify:CR=1 FL=1
MSINAAEKLRGFIPANVLALSVSSEGAINMFSSGQVIASWVVFCILLIGLPFYIWFVQRKKEVTALIIAILSFIILELSMGGPFARTWSDAADLIQGIGGLLGLIFAVLVIPIISAIGNR